MNKLELICLRDSGVEALFSQARFEIARSIGNPESLQYGRESVLAILYRLRKKEGDFKAKH